MPGGYIYILRSKQLLDAKRITLGEREKQKCSCAAKAQRFGGTRTPLAAHYFVGCIFCKDGQQNSILHGSGSNTPPNIV